MLSRSRFVSLAIAITLAMTFGLAAAVPALADSHGKQEAIKLGGDDLGKSREELGDRSLPREEASEQEERSEKGRKHRKHGKKEKCEDCDHKGKCKDGQCHHGKHKGKHRVHGYKQCLEKSIRAGNDFDESSRVCRAVFPGKGGKGMKKDQQE